ncbi:MAG: SelD-related putative sulfur metabolism protein [Thermocladium sp.]
MNRIERFESHIRKYAEVGVNLTSLALGCSVKVDLYKVLYPALSIMSKEMAGLNLDISPREDVAVLSGREAEVSRLITGLSEVKLDKGAIEEFEPDTVVLLAQVFQGEAGDAEGFAKAVLRLYKELGSTRRRILIGKGHSIVTTKPGTDVFIIDMIKTRDKEANGYVLANNDTIQVIDPTDEVASYPQVSVAISNALNDLFVKGAYEKLVIYPVYDAPSMYLNEMRANIAKFAESIGAELRDAPQPGKGYLLIGATVTGEIDKEPPFFYDKINEDFQVMVTGPLGQLSVIGTFVTIHIDQDLMRSFEEEVMSVDELEELKNETMKTMMIPNIDIAKVINRHLPLIGEEFDPLRHVAATVDISGPGIFVFKELAEQARVNIKLEKVPLVNDAVARFAAENYIMADATSGTNGSLAIVAHRKVIEELMSELSQIRRLKPMVIGRIMGKGSGELIVPSDVLPLIADKGLAAKLKSPVLTLDRKRRALIKLWGEVQGVGMRPTIRRKALAMGLTGMARNEADGSVTVIVEGDSLKIEELINWLRRIGVGRISRIDISWGEYVGDHKSFTISEA